MSRFSPRPAGHQLGSRRTRECDQRNIARTHVLVDRQSCKQLISRASSVSYPNGVMPAERASVPSSSVIPTQEQRDILPDAADSRDSLPGGGRSGLQLALILVASFMVVLDFTIVNIALPSIEHDFGLRTSVVQWVVTGYAIAFGGLLILGGRAADMLGRRRMFVSGLVVFSLASLAGGLAYDPLLLIAARAVQGAGAALIAPAAFSLITAGF